MNEYQRDWAALLKVADHRVLGLVLEALEILVFEGEIFDAVREMLP